MHLYETHKGKGYRDLIFTVVLFLVLLLLFALAFLKVTGTGGTDEERMLENAIRRAAVTCYAVEGRYPETLNYLCENYGVVVNRHAYRVTYDVFASNLMPEIQVSARGGDAS